MEDDGSKPRPVVALIDDTTRRWAITQLAIHNYTDQGLMSYHHWDFSVDLAISYIEKLEGAIAGREHQRSRMDPVNQRTAYERVP